ncbi:SusC/RagA family TonB-linked outer membrane protein [Hymenobacter sp. BT186]|uniref:SusC/RagA family TonB-linked outer membrane protein n=1 Tax=Hymenobacter telluris TaxID=2816474 RepID=A0A939EWJ1_9BACT|nr:SusC/RagA family TonB-linked outer membrane protein [Hymenobacter telluris]MBO0358713.1 SusC/RagA family TonB-linked outer membrane protein [Hymenobacter telluris]MBW3374739.1 SusC/RagA family TonB-linked outer membrane protein [Hymenobacter norwichensis]
MRKLLLSALLVSPALMQQAAAQNRNITGRVTDAATGQGLPGVTVLVKGTSIGASTNADGGYSLSVPASATTLTFSFIGYTNVERPIGDASTVNVGLATDAKQLGEVVVTALGVERTRNSLAYSATQVEGQNITVARNPNPINGLSGKVAGVTIRQSNTLGGSTSVNIRGTKSLFGNNQPLYVIDGVPISNSNTNTAAQQTGGGGYDYGNAASDLNPDDIATTTILKGAAATALYGERAANGVILITTKKGRKGLGVTINAGITGGRIDKSTFIKYQKEYGAGYGPYFDEYEVGGATYPLVQLSSDASAGPRFDPNLQVYQWNAFTPGNPNFGRATSWVAAANDPSKFFKTAVTLNNSIAVDGGNDNGYFKLGYNSVRDKGILPNSEVNKNIVNFAGSLNLTPRLTTSASVNFSQVSGKGRYATGYSGATSDNLMTNFRQWWQTNVDIKELEDAYNFQKRNATWNLGAATPGAVGAYWNNPYFSRYQSYETDSRYRTFGNVAATYKFAEWFNVLGRVTLDSYDEMQEERYAVTSVGVPSYTRYNRTGREANFDLIGNFSANISEDFSFKGLAGANLRRERLEFIRSSTNGGLVVPNLYTLSNSVEPLTAPTPGVDEVEQRRGVDGIFASATFGFKDMLFLDLTARRDKSTTLPKGNNAFIYPSVATGFVFSELLKDVTWLSYGKARINYAEVGQGAPIQSVNDVYDKPAAFGLVPLFSVVGTKNNNELKPERTKSAEAGVEMAFMQSRFGFDATVYQQNTIDQIIPVNVSVGTGYNARFINSGEVRNRGVEVSAFVSPVRNDDFTWTINANWTRNRNEVLSLYGEGESLVTSIQLASYQGGVTSNATVGKPFGIIRGNNFVYQNGQRVVLPSGYYQRSATANEEIADPNPKWTGGVSNTVAYKGLSLYFLIDIRKGGQVYSLDRAYGLDTGLQPETAGLNDLGNPSRNTIANGGGIIFPGVQADGSPNTVRADNSTESGATAYGYTFNPSAAFVYDASYAKLREVALTYSLPKTVMAKMSGVKGIDVSLVARNLWIISKNLPDADPEDALSIGNFGQGYSTGAYPTVRTLGANVRLSF